MSMVLFNIGWMKFYRGQTSDDPIVGGGSDVNKLEVENFLPLGGWHYGFGQVGSVNLSRIDAGVEDGAEELRGRSLRAAGRRSGGDCRDGLTPRCHDPHLSDP